MMDWILENAAIALLLAGIVWLLTRAARFRPAVEHTLWLVVLIRLVMPPLVDWPWSVALAPRPVPEDEGRDETGTLPLAGVFPELSRSPREESESRPLLPLTSRNEPPIGFAAGTDGDRNRPEPSRSEFERRELFTTPPRNEPATRVGSARGGDHGPEGVRLAVAGSPAGAGDRGESSPRLDAAGATPGNTLATSSASREARDLAPAGIAPAWTGGRTVDEPTAPPSAFSTAFPSPRAAAAGAWLAGGFLVLLLHLLRALRFRRFLRGSRPPPAWLARETRALAPSIGVRPPRVLVVPGRRSPAVWSLGRPALVVPAVLLERLERSAWRGVLLHELAHLRRRDHWVGWLLLAAGALHWWNPVLYLVRRRLRASAELACDAWVVEALPRERRGYAESLIDISAFAAPAPEPVPAIGVTSGTRKTYERRLRMILESHHGARLPLGGLVAAALLTLVALPGWSQSEPETAAEKPAADDVAVEEAPDSAGGLDEPLVEGEDEADAPDLLDAPAESSGDDLLEEGGEEGTALDTGEDGRPLDAAEEGRFPLRRFLDEHHIPVQEIERTLRDTLEDTQKHIGRLEERLDALLDDPRVKEVERKLEEGLEETREQLERLRAKLEDALDHPRVRELEREGREVLRDVLEELKGSLEGVIEELEPGERSRPRPRAEGRAFDRQREDAWLGRRRGTEDLFGPGEPPRAVAAPSSRKPACIRRIEFHRDAKKEKPFLTIIGECDARVGVVDLYRARKFARAGKIWQVTVREGRFEYRDYAIEPGKSYSYAFVARHPIVDSIPGRAQSPQVTTPPIPYDVNLYFTSITPGLQPTLTGAKSYWDYERGKVVKDVGYRRYQEKDTLDGEGGKWVIHRILDGRTTGGNEDVVEIRNRKDRRVVYKLEKNTHRPVEGWPAVEGDCDRTAGSPVQPGPRVSRRRVPPGWLSPSSAEAPAAPAPSDERILKIYKLPHEKAKVLADFLREHGRRELEVAVRGDQLIVAGPKRLHQQIEALVELIAPERRSSRRAPRESEAPAPDVKPAQ